MDVAGWAACTYILAVFGMFALAYVVLYVSAILMAIADFRLLDYVKWWWGINVADWPFYAISLSLWATFWTIVLMRRNRRHTKVTQNHR